MNQVQFSLVWPMAVVVAASLFLRSIFFRSHDVPKTRTVDVVDTLWNTPVADPYRWVEDDRDPEAWNGSPCKPPLRGIFWMACLNGRRFVLGARNFSITRAGIPRRIGEKVFLTRNDGLQPERHLRQRLDEAEERVFLDPNALSEDGTVTANLGASPDGRYVVEVRNAAGSDWQEMRVLDLTTGESTGEVLEW